MNHKNIRYCISAILLIGVLFAGALGPKYCQVNAVHVRAEPNTNSEILGCLALNDSIIPVAEKDNWYEINYQGREAWVYKAFFSEKKLITAKYWYNSKSGVLHNSNCKWYGNTKQGYFTNEAIGRDCSICGGAYRVKETFKETGYKYWINSKTNVRHNASCRWYGKTKQGYFTNEKVGRACKLCGG